MQESSVVSDVLDSFHGILFVKDASGEILFANRYMRDVLGFDPVGSRLDADIECFDCDRRVPGRERMWKHGDRLFLSAESPVRWGTNDEAIAVIGYDVTDRTRLDTELHAARDAAESSNAAKSRFLATMSHEIRTPLNAIMGMADIMLKTDLDERQAHYARTIKSSSRLLLKIIKDILDFSKIEAGKMVVEHKVFDLSEVVCQTVDTLRSQASDKGVALFVNIAPDVPPQVCSDPGKLQQILVNLLGNALKFTEKGFVTVTVVVQPEGDGLKNGPNGGEKPDIVPVLFQVQDSGVGIPADQLDSVFLSFTQVSGDSTRKFGGTGLGLSICRKIVQLLGGKITVSSTEGVGSTFGVLLPLQEVGVVREEPLSGKRPKSGGNKEPDSPSEEGRLAVLLVEDNPMNAEVTRLFLEQLGHVMVLAESGAQALDLLREGTFDLVLMDLELPDMNGNEVTTGIRNGLGGEQNRDIPVVSMTAHAFVEIRSECFRAGADDYLSKPVELETLQACLERTLAGSSMRHGRPKDSREASDSGEAILDPEKKLASLGGDREVLQKLYTLFLRDVPEQLETLHDMVVAGDVRQVADTAHTLKGSAGIIGAVKARELASLLEQAARKRETEVLQERFSCMRGEYVRIMDRVRSVLEDPDFFG
jgi:signal transduction histidine kinase/DNA-binding response OmpR family regulator